MKLLLTILACLVAASAGAQTIKSLGYNTTNGNIVAATNVTFTNSVGFSTNARAATRTNLGATTLGNSVFTATNIGTAQVAIFGTNVTINNSAGVEGISLSDGQTKLLSGISFPFLGGAAAAATSRTNFGLGGTNDVSFSRLSLSNGATNNLAVTLGSTNRGFSATSGPDRITTTVAGISAFSVFSNSIETGVGVAATFSTNVTVAGSLSVGSLTTTTPSTWALDATQTAAATNGVLTLPSNANVIRLTNNNAISSVTNGVLGAFYYLVNQATNAVTISNVGGITIDGAQNLTLSPNESATLVATGPTNVSVAARGDLTDVALGGTANTAPSQTASSGSSLMTRGLSDARYLPSFGEYMDGTFYRQTMADWMPTRVTNGGSATFDATGSRWSLSAATNVGNVVGLRMGRMEGITHSSSAGANSMWSSGFSAFVFTSVWSRSNQVLRFVVGHSTGDPIGQYPTNRAVGIEFSGDAALSARLIAHDGTTATNGPLVTGLRNTPYAAYDLYAVRYYTNGTVELYRSVARGAFTNIAAATITGGPTNNALINTAGAVDLAFDSGTNAAPGSTATRPQWWGYQYHD
jgi:hypothetical protein